MILCLALVFAFALYWPSLHGEFVFDDLPSICSHEKVWKGEHRRVNWREWRSISYWTLAFQIHCHGPVAAGAPIPQTLYFAIHSVNVLLHALAAVVVGTIVGLFSPESVTAATLLWIAMPVAVSSVAYMSARATLLASLFSLSALWCVLAGYPVVAVPLMALAMMSKEDHAVWLLGLAGAAFASGQPGWAAGFALAPAVLALVFRQRLRTILSTAHSPDLTDAGSPPPMPREHRRLIVWTELLVRFPQWVAGCALCIYPAFKKPGAARILAAVASASAAVVLASAVPDSRLPLWLMLCSPVALYGAFLQVRDPVMDYRAYSAMIGPFLLLVPVLDLDGLYILAACWAVRSFIRVHDWQTPLSLWKGAVRDGGGPVAWQNLGAAYQMRREFEKARECYARCPSSGVVLLNLGLIEGMEGKPAAARDRLEECVRLNPRYVSGWDYLRQVYEFLKDAPNVERCRMQLEALK